MTRWRRVNRVAGWIFLIMVGVMFVIGFWRKNIYDPKLGINILMIGKEGMALVGIRVTENMANFLVLPSNLLIQGEKGDYQVEAVAKVGLMDKDNLNATRLSVSRTLGVAMAGVIKTDANIDLAGLFSALSNLSTQTNLSLLDRIALYSDLSGLFKRGVRLELNFPLSGVDTVEEPDGRKLVKVNPAIFSWMKNQWTQDQVLSEGAEVAVINASGKDGLGRLISRQLESAGVRVIDVDSASDVLAGQCVLMGGGKAVPKTYQFILSTFACQVGSNKDEKYIKKEIKTDLVLVVGNR